MRAIETPIGFIPEYADLKALFKDIINKEYTEDLYTRQFSLYVDNIVNRIDLQIAAYGKEKNLPGQCMTVLNDQKKGLLELKERFGAVVKPSDLG